MGHVKVRLYEYQGKQLLRTAKISVPQGEVASTPEEAKRAAEQIGKPVTIKAQVWATGRSKAGGIRFANDPDEAVKVASELIGAEIKGTKVRKLLVEERLEIEKEFYAGVVVNTSREFRCPAVIDAWTKWLSTRGPRKEKNEERDDQPSRPTV